jgi:nickel-dependent lactate racemase
LEKLERIFKFKYGLNSIDLKLPQSKLIKEIKGRQDHKNDLISLTKNALENPIESPKLSQIVKQGEKVTIVISDITRGWQKSNLFLPFIIGELEEAGIELADITILAAVGSHRFHSEAEKQTLIGEKYYGKVAFKDHNCHNKDELSYLGKTSFGTPVYFNRLAVESDRLILTGGIVFHDLAGFSGGRKSLLPGIAGYQTITKNHALSLADKRGEGLKKSVDSNHLVDNPVHLDMAEAAALVKVDFIFNVIPDGRGGIAAAVAGDLIAAHQSGCEITSRLFGIKMRQKAELVFASCGGYPKDINLYQASKALVNAAQLVQKGGYLILFAECKEGIGHPEVEDIIQNYNDNLAREDFLRRDFTISRYTGYLITTAIAEIKLILFSNIERKILSNTEIEVIRTKADLNKILTNRFKELPDFYSLPDAANTLPIFED